MKLHDKATVLGVERRTVAKVTTTPIDENRAGYFLFVDGLPDQLDCTGYAGILTMEMPSTGKYPIPWIGNIQNRDILRDDYILLVEPGGFIHVIYRPESRNNAIFATSHCNNNCLMCSQPPRNTLEPDWLESHLQLIDLIDDEPDSLCITGGEPTLLGEGLISLLCRASTRLPRTHLYMLTNGRQFSDIDYVRKIAELSNLKLLSAVPLYADVAPLHDYIVQSKGAFDQTVQGLYNMARYKLPVEIRVVLHRQTIPRLLPLMEFIYRNFPFVSRVALMGLENMGFAKKNMDLLWIDPIDYKDELERAVLYLNYRQIPVSIFNLQLCVLNPSLRAFACKSISDFKNIYLEECTLCSMRDACAGLFQSSSIQHSRGINPYNINS